MTKWTGSLQLMFGALKAKELHASGAIPSLFNLSKEVMRRLRVGFVMRQLK